MTAHRLTKLIGVYARPFQELEDLFFVINNLRDWTASTTVGIHLDHIGEILGVARDDDTDARYIERIEVQILINRSHGTQPEILRILKLLAPGAGIFALRGFVAEFDVWITSTISEKLGRQLTHALNLVVAHGVKHFFTYHTSANYFSFVEDTGSDGSWLESANPGGFGY